MTEESLNTSIKIAVATAATEHLIENLLKVLEQQTGLPVVDLVLECIEVTRMQDERPRYLRRVQIALATWSEDEQQESPL